MLYDSVNDLDFSREDLEDLPLPTNVLLTTPDHFDVEYVINPHMKGNEGTVDKDKAQEEWLQVREAYTQLELNIEQVEGVEGLPDMVFCANQSFPYITKNGGKRGVILSRMHAEERRAEVPYFARYFRSIDHDVVELDASAGYFEGMGDAIWHIGKRLIWGGYGFRTNREVYQQIGQHCSAPVVLLRLVDDAFYHLDTCLSILDESTALVHLPAFDAESQDLLDALFDTLIDTSKHEAREGFACNAHCPDQQHVLIHHSCHDTISKLSERGFTPLPLDTSEFLKAGGSVFCMKLMHW